MAKLAITGVTGKSGSFFWDHILKNQEIVLPKRNLDKNNKANKVYNTQWRAHLMAERKRYSAEEKSAIVLEILQ
ncbi:MAG: hypothetical protein MSH65_00270, partial [Spirochaetia bacterium]|nr:hypothetical protein [Spirochaetia bacterium]